MWRSAALATTFLLALASSALAQQVPTGAGSPDPMVCVYNTTLPSIANGQAGYAQCDSSGRIIISNPGSGGGGGSAASQTASNATDGQATQAANQQAVTYNYLFNGTTWDRMRGTNGYAGVFLPNNAVASPLFDQLVQGGAALSTTNGLPTTDTNASQSFTAGGTSAAKAQAVQGITNGIPLPVTGAFYQATQPVSGTVTANQGGAPWSTTISGAVTTNSAAWAGTALGAPSNYGTSPGAVAVPGVNAFITNTPGVTEANGANVVLGNNTDGASCASGTSHLACERQVHSDLIGAVPAAQAGPALGPAAAQGVVQQDNQTITVTGSAAGALTNATYTTGAIPTAGYQSAYLQFSAVGTGNTFVVQESNDGVNNWTTAGIDTLTNVGGAAPGTSTSGTAGMYRVALQGAYFRVSISTYGSGTPSVIVAMKVAPLAPLGVNANITNKPAVSIDQTTPGTTNGAYITNSGLPTSYYSTSLPTIGAGFTPLAVDVRGNGKMSETGSSDPLVGITPGVIQSGTSATIKASAGNLYSVYAMAVAAPSAQEYLVCINAAAVPAAAAAITPVDVAPIGQGTAAIGNNVSINYGAGPPNAYSTGITCLVTTSLTTYTAGANTFISARVR